MSNITTHGYHLVDESPWPLLRSLGAFFLTCGFVKWFWAFSSLLAAKAGLIILLVMCQWWRDVSAEASYQGLHRGLVELGIRWGMALFIVSEVFFFLSFFWAFFHRSLSVSVFLGRQWPPRGIHAFNPWQVPLLNTLILLRSGVRVTWAHHGFTDGNHSQATLGLGLTVILGAYFTGLQALEYYEAKFAFRDGAYGSTFFIATGFHGLHVIVGSIFLTVRLARTNNGLIRPQHHFGFEAAAWYWHFVDVVWLFLFITIYMWGGAEGYTQTT